MTDRQLGSSWTASRDRRGSTRHDKPRADTVARVMGGSDVRLIDLSRRGLLVETESRLAIGAKTTIRIATIEGIVYVRGLVVRSRVAGIGNGIVFHTALALEEDLALADALAREQAAFEEILGEEALTVPLATTDADADRAEGRDRAEASDARAGRHTGQHDFEFISLDGLRDDGEAVQYALFETSDFFTPPPGEPESLNLTVTVPHALEELQHLAVERGDDI